MGDVMRQCAELAAGAANKGRLLGILTAGRATGRELPLVAKELDFQIVHIYPRDISPSIAASFPKVFDYPDITFDSDSDLEEVVAQVKALADSQSLTVAGFIAGMDYGVKAQDRLNLAFQTPGNTPNNWRNGKGPLNDHLRTQGVPVPQSQTFPLDGVLDGITGGAFPVHIKPSVSFASIGAGACPSEAHLRQVIARLKAESQRMGLDAAEVVVEELLHPNTIYFINTINVVIGGKQKRIVTGMAIDNRSNDFSPEVWDTIIPVPPRHLLPAAQRRLFDYLVTQNQLVLERSETTVGSSHLEFMARGAQVRVAEDLLPIDLNLRLPGLDYPRIELMTNGFDPYILDIVSHTDPHLLADFPEIYQHWKQPMALVFLRSHWKGTVSQEGWDWLQSLLNHPQPGFGGAHLTKISVSEAHSPVVVTEDGSTMQGFVHVSAPTMGALRSLIREIRLREKNKFFVAN